MKKLAEAAAASYIKTALSPQFVGRALSGAGVDRMISGVRKGVLPGLKGSGPNAIAHSLNLKRPLMQRSLNQVLTTPTFSAQLKSAPAGARNLFNRSLIQGAKDSSGMPSLRELR